MALLHSTVHYRRTAQRLAQQATAALWTLFALLLLALPALIGAVCFVVAWLVGWCVAAVVDGYMAGRGRS